MKYLLDFLSGLDGAPSIQDPDFQKLLVDVQTTKTQKSADSFNDNLEKIVNELKTSPEAVAFLKPVSKREAPDYHEVIKYPMDLQTIGRNIKANRYKSKADFALDLDRIWENCLIYNSQETHPLRASARYMRQKSEHHLEFLQDRHDKQPLLPITGLSPTPSFSLRQTPGPSGLQNVMLGDEDADGESEDDGERSTRAVSVNANGNVNGTAAKPIFRDDRPNLTPAIEALQRTSQGTVSCMGLDLEGEAFWTAVGKDEAYTGFIPTQPTMLDSPPSMSKAQAGKSLQGVVQETVDSLADARRIMYGIADFQRAEQEGLLLPYLDTTRRPTRPLKRRRISKIDQVSAAESVRYCSASMLAHAGFEGANEAALDLFTRMATEHLRNLGRTFRLLMDGFSGEMSTEDIVYHALNENGHTTSQLESHIRDEIEREGSKVAEMERKVKQAYADISTAPTIEGDMVFANDAEMLLDGNFADQVLGEDFLGLAQLGIAQEHGMTSLSIPPVLFYKRRKGQIQTQEKTDQYSTIPLIPLNPATYQQQVPGLLHAFFAHRVEASQLGDDPFDAQHNQIGTYGQINAKLPPPLPKKKVEVVKQKPKKKAGVGKGNWSEFLALQPIMLVTAVKDGAEIHPIDQTVRPSKEEKARRAAEMANFPSALPPVAPAPDYGPLPSSIEAPPV